MVIRATKAILIKRYLEANLAKSQLIFHFHSVIALQMNFLILVHTHARNKRLNIKNKLLLITTMRTSSIFCSHPIPCSKFVYCLINLKYYYIHDTICIKAICPLMHYYLHKYRHWIAINNKLILYAHNEFSIPLCLLLFAPSLIK